MENMNVEIYKYQSGASIAYPATTLSPALHLDNFELSLPDIYGDYIHYGDNGKFNDRGYNVHHIETLKIAERYVRGLIEHHGITYVFSARMETQNIGVLSYKKLVEAAIEHIDDLQISNALAGEEIKPALQDVVKEETV